MRAFQAFAVAVSVSRRIGKLSGMFARKCSMRERGSARLIARTSNGSAANAARSRSMEGISSRQGSHQVAQKFTSTTLPR
jgi:hypothetical protein